MSKETLRDVIAQAFVKALSEDTLPWRSMWLSQRAYNAVNGKFYRGINALWLSYVAAENGYNDSRWCTFKQAQGNGWSVKKGEKATGVEFWSIYDKKTRQNLSIFEANLIISRDPDRSDDMRLFSKQYSVFNANQIEGMPELEQQPCAVDITSVRAKRDVLITNMGLKFYEGGDQAFYSPLKDSITMPPDVNFENTYAYMSTFLHECGHATGASTRLNRPLGNAFGSEGYAKEELRAEIASAFMSQALGFDSESATLSDAMDNHKAYIQNWISVIQDKPNELFAAIKDAEKIADYLIEKGEFDLPEQREPVKASLDAQINNASKQVEDSFVSFEEVFLNYR